MNEKITMQDVAKKAGVDKATVSRVLRGDPRISEKTRERVVDAVRGLDYHLDRNARNLSTKKSGIIGVVLREMQSAWLPSFLSGLDRIMSNTEYEIMVKSTDGNSQRASRELRRLSDRSAEGVIWCDTVNQPRGSDVPLIVVGRRMDGVFSIISQSGELTPDFDTGVLAGRLLLNVITGKVIPSHEIIVSGAAAE